MHRNCCSFSPDASGAAFLSHLQDCFPSSSPHTTLRFLSWLQEPSTSQEDYLPPSYHGPTIGSDSGGLVVPSNLTTEYPRDGILAPYPARRHREALQCSAVVPTHVSLLHVQALLMHDSCNRAHNADNTCPVMFIMCGLKCSIAVGYCMLAKNVNMVKPQKNFPTRKYTFLPSLLSLKTHTQLV